MNSPDPHPCIRRLFAGLIPFMIVLPAAASPTAAPEALRVAVFDDHYRLGNSRFASLAELDKALSRAPQALARNADGEILLLDRCGKAPQPLLAAVEHFRGGVIEIRSWPSNSPMCSANTSNRPDRAYLATDRYGRSVIP